MAPLFIEPPPAYFFVSYLFVTRSLENNVRARAGALRSENLSARPQKNTPGHASGLPASSENLSEARKRVAK